MAVTGGLIYNGKAETLNPLTKMLESLFHISPVNVFPYRHLESIKTLWTVPKTSRWVPKSYFFVCFSVLLVATIEFPPLLQLPASSVLSWGECPTPQLVEASSRKLALRDQALDRGVVDLRSGEVARDTGEGHFFRVVESRRCVFPKDFRSKENLTRLIT